MAKALEGDGHKPGVSSNFGDRELISVPEVEYLPGWPRLLVKSAHTQVNEQGDSLQAVFLFWPTLSHSRAVISLK
jgi:hypothetical protein